jgi:hypothetical protein
MGGSRKNAINDGARSGKKSNTCRREHRPRALSSPLFLPVARDEHRPRGKRVSWTMPEMFGSWLVRGDMCAFDSGVLVLSPTARHTSSPASNPQQHPTSTASRIDSIPHRQHPASTATRINSTQLRSTPTQSASASKRQGARSAAVGNGYTGSAADEAQRHSERTARPAPRTAVRGATALLS